MKVGTDGVLLGAWSDLDHQPQSILDVGSGTGLIGLLLAQRSEALTIDAVEVDGDAYEQTVENFEQSDWADRLFCYHSSFQEFAEEMADEEEQYDLIVSNPPFYTDAFETKDDARNKARFTSSLSFEELVGNVVKILSKQGVFCVIVPYKEEVSFVKLCDEYQLSLHNVCRVKGTPSSPYKRSLLGFSFEKKAMVEEELIIETSRHNYTETYENLTKDFYLKM